MKIMVFLILIIVAYMAFFKQTPDPVELAKYETTQSLIKEQEQILEQLQAYNNKEVQIFIDQWRDFAKEPSNEQLAELKQINENIKKNPSIANKYTIQWH
ncbi:hypothetical protein OQE09_004955, partial [Salmonella enterica]|nr:hypothetical protein [Salmonella enterica]